MVDLRKMYILLSFILSACTLTAVDGTMDRYFAMGQSYEQLPICKAVATQPDGKVLVAGYIEAYGKKTFAIARLHANGMLDDSFGKNGVTQTLFTNGETASSAQALMIDSMGRIVAAGFTNGINNQCHACLARYNEDGSLDKSFFGGRAVFKGTVITTFGSLEEVSHINGLVQTVDQKIVAVGGMCDNKAARFAIARYNPNGSLDASFNPKSQGSGCGTVCTQFDSSENDEAFAVALDAHGKIVVAGSSCASGVKTFALARYHEDGSLDNSLFGGNATKHGTVITNFMCGETEGAARAVCVQADGKILAGGYTNAFCGGQNNTHFALARYTAQGALDVGFGTDSCMPGTIVTNFGNEKVKSCINALLIQTDSKIVAGGFAEFNKTKYFALARYDNNGACDYTFNGGGAPSGKVLSRSSSHNSDEIFGLALASPGDIIAVGRSKNDAMCYGAIARYMCDQDMAAPEILSPCHNEVVVNGAKVKVKGRAQNSSRVQMYLDDKLIDTMYVKGNQCWDCKLPALTDGEHCLQVCERYEAGNVIMQSRKIKFMVDQNPVAINQTMECHGMRVAQGSLAARGASGDYLYKITKENNCKVTLLDNGAYKVKAAVPSGQASFDFEVKDKVTNRISSGTVSLIVREIPVAGSIALDTAQDKPLHGNLELFVMGGQPPYSFEVMNDNSNFCNCTFNPDGSFTFTPKPEFIGMSGFKFWATDTYKVMSDPARVSVQVNSLPKAKDIICDGYVNRAISGNVSSNSIDGRRPYKYHVTSVQNHCSVMMEENGAFTCMPEANYCGQISFEYVIVDARGNSSAPCAVHIDLVEMAELNPEEIVGIKNKTIKKNLNRFVSKGRKPFKFALDKGTQNGTLTVNENGVFEFIPHDGFVGDAQFSVKVCETNVFEKIEHLMTIMISIKDMQDFESVPVDIYEGEYSGNLQKPLNEPRKYKYSLFYAPDELKVVINNNGEFTFHTGENKDSKVEFLYTIADEAGNKEIKKAHIVFHTHPVAQSISSEIAEVSVINGNLNDLVSEGIAPFTYKILSAKNGKIECHTDGTYTFKPRFDVSETAEFTYMAIDGRDNSSNVGSVEFHLPPKPAIIQEVQLPAIEILQEINPVELSPASNESEVMINEIPLEAAQSLIVQLPVEVQQTEATVDATRSSRLHRFIRSINK